jgi:acetyl esterase/lipase
MNRIPLLIMIVFSAFAAGVSGQVARPEWGKPARDEFPLSSTVRVVRDITYARYGNREMKLDLYLPAAPQGAQRGAIPVIIVIRGNGWRSGDKETFGFIAGRLAENGLAAASIEYRTSEEALFPGAVNDAKAAVRWLRNNAEKHNIDPRHIGVLGTSAGAHIAAFLGTTAHLKSFDGDGGNSEASSAVQAVVAFAAPTDLRAGANLSVQAFLGTSVSANPRRYEEASPIAHVTKTAAPILMIHSKRDATVPYAQSNALAARYAKEGAHAVLVPLEDDAPHAFWNFSRWFPSVMDRAVAFLSEHLVR